MKASGRANHVLWKWTLGNQYCATRHQQSMSALPPLADMFARKPQRQAFHVFLGFGKSARVTHGVIKFITAGANACAAALPADRILVPCSAYPEHKTRTALPIKFEP